MHFSDKAHLEAERTERVGRVERATRESSIVCSVNLDGTGKTDISTGLPFFDHMLTAFGSHGSFDLTVHANGDTEVDAHHTVEDTGIVMGQAFAQALGDKSGIRRFGDSFIPMDETLTHAVVDVSGRPYFVGTGEPEQMLTAVIGGHYATVINEHFFESFALNARIALQFAVSTAAIRTTSPRLSTRLRPVPCVLPSRTTRASTACRRLRARCRAQL